MKASCSQKIQEATSRKPTVQKIVDFLNKYKNYTDLKLYNWLYIQCNDDTFNIDYWDFGFCSMDLSEKDKANPDYRCLNTIEIAELYNDGEKKLQDLIDKTLYEYVTYQKAIMMNEKLDRLEEDFK
jgi:hypothetical protein